MISICGKQFEAPSCICMQERFSKLNKWAIVAFALIATGPLLMATSGMPAGVMCLSVGFLIGVIKWMHRPQQTVIDPDVHTAHYAYILLTVFKVPELLADPAAKHLIEAVESGCPKNILNIIELPISTIVDKVVDLNAALGAADSLARLTATITDLQGNERAYIFDEIYKTSFDTAKHFEKICPVTSRAFRELGLQAFSFFPKQGGNRGERLYANMAIFEARKAAFFLSNQFKKIPHEEESDESDSFVLLSSPVSSDEEFVLI